MSLPVTREQLLSLLSRLARQERRITSLEQGGSNRLGTPTAPEVNGLALDGYVYANGQRLPLRDLLTTTRVEDANAPDGWRIALALRADALVAVGDAEFGKRANYATMHGKAYPANVATTARVDAVGGDVLHCRAIEPVEWQPVGEPGNLIVAKPYLLRRTPFGSQTATYLDYHLPSQQINYVYSSAHQRLASEVGADPPNNEQQVITPAYIEGEEITIIRMITGMVHGGFPVVWSDMNTGGRTWTEKP